MISKHLFRLMHTSELGFRLAIFLLAILRFFTLKKYLSDQTFLEQQFIKFQGYKLDLNNCKTINEKMQWLKLNDRSENHTLLADKYAARSFFEKKYGTKYLIDLCFHTKDWRDVKPENMPDFPFIIKPNHGSGWFYIIHDKSKVNWKRIQTESRYWLTQNYFWTQREWQYKNIEPRIIVEKLLICKNGRIPTNYRVHCMNGKVQLIALTIYLGNTTDDYKNLKFSRDWEYLDFDWAEKNTDFSKLRYNNEYSKPDCLNEMIEIAENISKHFKYVRVDFYEVDDKLYHGEVTFHDGGGNEKIQPFEWDLKLGSMLDLNKQPHA